MVKEDRHEKARTPSFASVSFFNASVNASLDAESPSARDAIEDCLDDATEPRLLSDAVTLGDTAERAVAPRDMDVLFAERLPRGSDGRRVEGVLTAEVAMRSRSRKKGCGEEVEID